ncbi:MAG: TIGR04053 family radical SAM/SPASM domain-containing protein [Candidatus Koribacter versatilis]|uniref:TIGR04053 family radical SAM/SPASM domain-containing protein n=1 Tax=Candidatus Korobacter versatilis TaxID=658062 RepID=A0A932A6P6_9BACT|nr:TIGR04053 family radical SAM/SPASM domain-containing protein [Candidatus Koribacter versatilis]
MSPELIRPVILRSPRRRELRQEFNERPLVVIWEMTQACDLKCAHCRANAQPNRAALELSVAEGYHLIDQVAEMGVPIFVLTGGDPLKRPDLFAQIKYAVSKGLKPCLTPSATPLLTREAVRKLKEAGLARLALSLDGSTPQLHDGTRGVAGSWAKTIETAKWASEVHLPLQINTTISRRNAHDLEAMAQLLAEQKVVQWSLFFLVPVGRGQAADLLTPEEHEEVFARMWELSQRMPFRIKTTEAPHYRRFVLQKKAEAAGPGTLPEMLASAQSGFGDGKGFMFVSHVGQVFPSGFLPLPAGNVLWEGLAAIYRKSSLFMALRDPDQLKGKCGVCEFREICGGSRARAYAFNGDPLSSDPCCSYNPPGTVN